MTLELDLTFKKSYIEFQFNISKHTGEKCGNLCISSIPKFQKGHDSYKKKLNK